MKRESDDAQQGAVPQQEGAVQAASGGQAAGVPAAAGGESAAGGEVQAAAEEGEGEGDEIDESPPSKRARQAGPADQPSSAEPNAFLSAYPAPGTAPFGVDAALLGARFDGTVEAVSDSAYFVKINLGGQEFKGERVGKRSMKRWFVCLCLLRHPPQGLP